MSWFFSTVLAWIIMSTTAHAELSSSGQSECTDSLLSDHSRIPPSAFSATSEMLDASGYNKYSAQSVRAHNADQAWCPSRKVGMEFDEYLQIDTGELKVFTKLVVNGLLAEGGVSRFTPYFYLRYKRESTEPEWRTYRQLYPVNTSRLSGSSTAWVPKFVNLDPPLIARWIRIYPSRDNPGFVCVRLEAYGCSHSTALVEYQIPEGSVAVASSSAEAYFTRHPLQYSGSGSNITVYHRVGRGRHRFTDICYDGYRVEPGSLLDGGLGCLTDLGVASNHLTPGPLQSLSSPRSSTTVLSPTHDWFVGWHRSRWRAKSSDSKDVVHMRFRFANLRIFDRIRFFVSNNFVEKVRLPRRIEIRFSFDGVEFFYQHLIAKDFDTNNLTKGVVQLDLDLLNRTGKFIQAQVFFGDEWLLISEVKFQNHLAPDSAIWPGTVTGSQTDMDKTMETDTEHSEVPTAELVDRITARHLPVIIVLSVLIVAFLFVIAITCIRYCCRRGICGRWGMQHRSINVKPTVGRRVNGDGTGACGLNKCNNLFTNGTWSRTTRESFKNNLNGNGFAGQNDAVDHQFQHPEYPTINNHSFSTSEQLSEQEALNSGSSPQSTEQWGMGRMEERQNDHNNKTQKRSLFDWLNCGRKQSDSKQVHDSNRTQAELYTTTQFVSNPALASLFPLPQYDGQHPNFSMYPASQFSHMNSALGPDALLNMGCLTNCHQLPFITQPHGPLPMSSPPLVMNMMPQNQHCLTATNSTGTSAGLVNTDSNLYTTVGGESDEAESNGNSSMSHEYASTNPMLWPSTTQPLLQLQRHQPIYTAATGNKQLQAIHPFTASTAMPNVSLLPPSLIANPIVYLNQTSSSAPVPLGQNGQLYGIYTQPRHNTYAPNFDPSQQQQQQLLLNSLALFGGSQINSPTNFPPVYNPSFYNSSLPFVQSTLIPGGDHVIGNRLPLDSIQQLSDAGNVDPWIRVNQLGGIEQPPPLPSSPPPPLPPNVELTKSSTPSLQ